MEVTGGGPDHTDRWKKGEKSSFYAQFVRKSEISPSKVRARDLRGFQRAEGCSSLPSPEGINGLFLCAASVALRISGADAPRRSPSTDTLHPRGV